MRALLLSLDNVGPGMTLNRGLVLARDDHDA